MTTVYIAGPMTGIPDWNYPLFFETEKQLKALGYDVINPAHHDGLTLEEAIAHVGTQEVPANPWSYYMKRDLPQVIDADLMCVLPGWQVSRGANLETIVAANLGIPLMVLQDGELKPRVTAIGLSGWARSGKDTIADYLVANYGFTKVSFAEPMRAALYAIDPIVGPNMRLRGIADTYGWDRYKDSSYGTEIRELMQRFGTEFGRKMLGENVWVELAISSVPDGAKVVFSDVRFPNEAGAVKELGGEVWRIHREGITAANDHISEHALDDYHFDVDVYNDSDLDSLYSAAKTVMERHGEEIPN